MYSQYFVIISPWKWEGSFIWSNLNPLHPRIIFDKFGWKWPSGSGEDENVKSLRTDGQTDRHTTNDRWSEKLTWAFSSGELKKDRLLNIDLLFFRVDDSERYMYTTCISIFVGITTLLLFLFLYNVDYSFDYSLYIPNLQLPGIMWW